MLPFLKPKTLHLKPNVGYTIIELLVVVAITALLASFVFTFGKGGRQQIALMVERAKIAQVIFRARSLAISTYNQPSPPCAYGVHFDYGGGTYTLNSYLFSPCSGITNVTGISTPLETYTLGTGLVYGTAGSSPLSDVLFFPPDPATLVFTNAGVTSTDASVYLSTTDGTGAANIDVTSAGEVTF
jgi:prepilin-type N-terminal cleavage/methylation domain-containing protein